MATLNDNFEPLNYSGRSERRNKDTQGRRGTTKKGTDSSKPPSPDALLLEIKRQGSKRYAMFWLCSLFLLALFINVETNATWHFYIGGITYYLLLKSIGDISRMSQLLVVFFLSVSIIGTIYWNWWTIPSMIALTGCMAYTHYKWVHQPIFKFLNLRNKDIS